MARPVKAAVRRVETRKGNQRENNRNRKVRPARKTKTGIWMMVMLLFFVQALFYAWCRVQCVNAGYGIDRETRRHQELMRDRNALKIEWARLKSPERIETIARTRLDLEMPGLKQTIIRP